MLDAKRAIRLEAIQAPAVQRARDRIVVAHAPDPAVPWIGGPKHRGQLVAIGSLAGYRGLPRTAAYSASKAAVYNFFESLRIDLRGTGVDITVITPGYVRSEMTARNAHSMPF
ncbi:MAG: SDR family NAD(P)-dependent oxidoreductase, partial [Myxococcales bacterium]|nr:SDR family NAD(P)-dependent oxidoreductase [Myxococcales bacterium]